VFRMGGRLETSGNRGSRLREVLHSSNAKLRSGRPLPIRRFRRSLAYCDCRNPSSTARAVGRPGAGKPRACLISSVDSLRRRSMH
jgi:hypothetical protein